jgi:aldehyde dehydrogenase (NAD+)
MEELVKLQRQYFNTNATKPLAFRIVQLNKLDEVIRSSESLIYDAIYKDYGKSKFETELLELFLIYDEINTAVKELEEWARIKPVETNILNMPAKSYIVPEPLGVSLIIGPWNYPINLLFAPLVAAIAAGCTAVLKPSELTANCSAISAKIINENFDPAYLRVVEGGIPETSALLEQKFDSIFFTGSVPVGKVVYQAAAKHLTPVTLELGGKSPVIIMPGSDIDLTVKRLVWAKFVNSGQTCIAPDYIYVHSSIEQEFLEKMKAEIIKSDFSVANGNYVKIVNERNAARVSGLIDPAKIYFGGRFDVAERDIEPTIMTSVTWDDKVMHEEIFGPVLPVMTFDNLDEVIATVKDHPKPLAVYLFTNDEAIKGKVLSEVSFGGGCINDAVMHVSNGYFPFGGVGESGLGSYHGEPGFRAFSHYKSILDRPFMEDPDVKYSPHTEEKLNIIKSFTA